MGILGNLFKSRQSGEISYIDSNKLARSLWQWITPGTMLSRDSHTRDYVKNGYEGNVDVYSFIDRLSNYFAQIDLCVQDRKGKIVERSDLWQFIERPNGYQSGLEWRKLFYTFLLATGNGIIYTPKLENGNNAGKVLPDSGLFMVPTQYVEIRAQGPFKPVGAYLIDFNNTEANEMAPEHITHVRYPNLEYVNGQNFMGMSPLKAASDLINSQNLGYKITSQTYKNPIPPGILSQEGNSSVEGNELKRNWKKKYSNPDSSEYGIPVFVNNKVQYIPLSLSNLQDLQVIPNSQEGRRALANVYGVPAQLFNDTSASTYNNMKEAKKAIYVNRVVPDMKLFLNELNWGVSKFYDNGQNKIVAKFDEIPELQEDLQAKSTWVYQGIDRGVYSRDEGREIMGKEPTGEPAMQIRTVQLNTMPLDMALGSEDIQSDEADKFYRDNNMEDQM